MRLNRDAIKSQSDALTMQEYRQAQIKEWNRRNAEALRRDFWKRKGLECSTGTQA